MTIERLGSNTNDSGSSSPLSWSHTLVAGSDRKVIVLIGFENDGNLTPSATYGGEAMTEAAGCKTGVADLINGAYVFYIDEADLPSDGANDVVVTFSGSTNEFEVFGVCASFEGVASGIEDSDSTCESSPGNDTIETTGFSGSAIDLFVAAYTCGETGTNWTYGQNQNELLDGAGASSRAGFTDLISIETYYFDGYGAEQWNNPDAMVDGSTASHAWSAADGNTQLLNSNTCPGTDLGTITKVELRVYGAVSGTDPDDDDLILRPVFGGSSDGDDHQIDIYGGGSGNKDWSAWIDITTDTNAPGTWDWDDVVNLDCDVVQVQIGALDNAFAGMIEIRVSRSITTLEGTFSSGANRLGTAAAHFLDAEVAPSVELEQEGFRWRNDNDDEVDATWRQDQDVDDEIAKETNIRLRTLLNATGDPDSQQFEIQYKESSDAASEWRKIPEA
jgi:hypothetical protein